VETYETFKGFGIRYISITGTTFVEDFGFILKQFVGYGEIHGRKAAEEYINSIA
jgi:hypothetical protein